MQEDNKFYEKLCGVIVLNAYYFGSPGRSTKDYRKIITGHFEQEPRNVFKWFTTTITARNASHFQEQRDTKVKVDAIYNRASVAQSCCGALSVWLAKLNK